MLVLLPAVAFVLVLVLARRRFAPGSWRDAFLLAAIGLGAVSVLATEALSAGGLIGRPGVIAYWIAVIAAAAIGLARTPRAGGTGGAAGTEPAPAEAERLTLGARLLLAGIVVYVVGTGVIAIVAPPNTWDVMEYHLPKVMHWIQNGSIGFYPTAIPRQNHLAPGAEFAVLHLHLLAGSDRFTNLVAWFSMLGCAIGVSLITRRLGANLLAQVVATAFTVTLPMGIMQASSAQTDYVAAFWFVSFVYFLLRLLAAPALSWPLLLAMSAALGLAVFTKATAYLLAPPFLVWMAVVLVRRLRWRVLAPFAAITAVFLVLNAGHYARNTRVYGHPLGPREEPTPNSRYALESHAPAALVSSLAKHVGTHLNSPWVGFNAAVQRQYVALHEHLGWKFDDPRTSFGPAFARFRIGRTDFQDETAGNPLHFFVGLLGFALVLAVPTLRRDRALLTYALAIGVSFLLFAGYLKWHPWMSRLHLGVFVGAAPFVAIALTRVARGWPALALAGLLLVLSLPWLLFCQERPLIARENIFNTPREGLYFKTPHQKYAAAYVAASEFFRAHPVTRVGLITGNSSWEYMAWRLFPGEASEMRFQHVMVQDPSGALAALPPFGDFGPEAIVALDQRNLGESVTIDGRTFTRRWREGAVAIFLPPAP
ncbi:hypothetical protein [Opitutus sp. ER46]|uniref:hypothetical protein n=1 Tax=Opitutus sp. ER46 TaxID=2161864 RepID=UPI000D310DB1|nr:hypothetical protein [Opitutus sp. ER46]PTX91629.1 hypothetical protein DB354_17305 [Opitutus sp. ER46]